MSHSSSDEDDATGNPATAVGLDAQDIDLVNFMSRSVEPRIHAFTGRELDWITINEHLRSSTLMDTHTNVFGAEFLRMPVEMVHTMNGVSKSWRTVEPGSATLLTDESEGGSWAFCENCVAQIPKNIQEILFFFHRLKTSLLNLKGYAVPSKSFSFSTSKDAKSEYTHIIWHRQPERSHAQESDVADADDEIDMNKIMRDRSKNDEGEVQVQVDPIKIRLGKTGAFYVVDGKKEVMTFSVLVITWARNFDMLGYIKEVFLRPPKVANMWHDFQKMDMIWKKMQRFVAFDNLGLDEAMFGTPEQYSHQPGGELGVDSLFNLFQIPLQIRGIIRRTVLERMIGRDKSARLKDVRVSAVQIVGLPELSFKDDDQFGDFVSYMHSYVDNLSNERAGYKGMLSKVNRPKDKDDSEAGEAASFTLDNPGAWPLERSEDGEYVRFGLPPLPIWLNFTPEINPNTQTNQELWFATIGGSDGLPELTKMCLRSFLVQSTDHSGWGQFLVDNRPANSMLVLQQYYSEQADPLAGLTTSGNLRSWWLSMKKHISIHRAGGGSVQVASDRFTRFVESAVHQHISSIHSGSYRSARLQQALSIMVRMDFVDTVGTSRDSIGSFKKLMCAHMSSERRFDSYQRANETFYRAWETLNKAFMMNSSNLEFGLEMMVSQVMWNMGEFNTTVPAFFQGIHVMSGNGHFKMTTGDCTFTLGDKVNSSGMDWTLGRVCELTQWLLDMSGFMDPRLNLQSPVNVMGWTPVSMQLNTCASVQGPHLQSLPDPTLSHQSTVITEMRAADMDSMIKYGYPRQTGGQKQLTLNTCDPGQDNKRLSMSRIRMNDIQFCGMSSNVRNPDEERLKTSGVVLARMPGGSGPHIKKQKVDGFNNSTSDSFGGRQSKSPHKDALAHTLVYTHVFALAMVALFNRSGVMPYEISPVSLAFLDWVSYWMKDHAGGTFDNIVYESFKRMKEGYEARQVTKALWTTCIRLLPTAYSKEKAIQRIAQTMHCNALPIAEVVPAMHCFMSRGVHMGCLLMMSVIAKHLSVPVIQIEQLQRFFERAQVI